MKPRKFTKKPNTSWEKSSKWYNEIVGTEGHYYHQHVVLPGIFKLLSFKSGDRLLDLGCGQGVLAKKLPPGVSYVGVDASYSLVKQAQASLKKPHIRFMVADATKPLTGIEKNFSHAAAILSLQNMANPAGAIANAANHLQSGGQFILILNHPSFRIPRQSGWGTNPGNKQQYRWVTKYMSEMKIPIQMHPGREKSEVTWSFHHPLTNYSTWLFENSMVIEKIEEWVTDKMSDNKMENMSKVEIPLFMAIVARKH